MHSGAISLLILITIFNFADSCFADLMPAITDTAVVFISEQ